MNTLQLIVPWMARHRPASFSKEDVASFVHRVANVAVNVDVFPPPEEPWSFITTPVEHITVVASGAPYCDAGIFMDKRRASLSETFGVFDPNASDDYCIVVDRQKVATTFSPPRRLALWRNAVREAFPDIGEDDQGLLAAYLCRAHIMASCEAEYRWTRAAKISIAISDINTTTTFELNENTISIPHHFLWEEALDAVMRFAAKQASNFLPLLASPSDANEELLDSFRALSRKLVEEYDIGTAYARNNPHLLNVASSFNASEMPCVEEKKDSEATDTVVFVDDEEEDDDDDYDGMKRLFGWS